MGYLCSWTVEELRDVIALLQEDVRSATEIHTSKDRSIIDSKSS